MLGKEIFGKKNYNSKREDLEEEDQQTIENIKGNTKYNFHKLLKLFLFHEK